MSDETYDEGEHNKEVYAQFGLTFYLASVLETGLAIALMQTDFLSGVRDDYLSTRGKGFSRAKFEAEFDSFMDRQHAQTMGNLLKALEKFPILDEALRERIVAAKAQRDFLSHHFFREKAEEFATRDGRDRMITELIAARELFVSVDEELQAAMQPVRQKLGMNEERMETYVREYIEAIRAGREPSDRTL